MSLVLWPLVAPQRQEWRHLAAAVVHGDPLKGTSQVAVRPGARWGSVLSYDAEDLAPRGWLAAFLTACQGPANTFTLHDVSRETPRGSLASATAQAMANADAEDATGTSGWVNGANASISLAAPVWRLTLTVGSSGSVGQDLTLDASAAYVFRGYIAPGNKPAVEVGSRVGTTAGGGELAATQTQAGAHWFTRAFTSPPSGTTYVRVLMAAGGSIGDYAHFGRVSVTRCATVDGAAQVGQYLAVADWPGGTLEVGDLFELDGTLYVATAPVTASAGGTALLAFAPALRASPADDAPVIFYRASATCRLTGPNVSRTDTPGVFSGFTIDALEAL